MGSTKAMTCKGVIRRRWQGRTSATGPAPGFTSPAIPEGVSGAGRLLLHIKDVRFPSGVA